VLLEGFFATKLNDVVGLARANSLWLAFATSCCGIEFMATMASHYDLPIWFRTCKFSPRQADMLMVMGTISKKMAPILRQVYEQMSEPLGNCCWSLCFFRWNFDTYSVLQGIDKVFLDVYVPGCPPRPEQIVDGVMKLQELVRTESVRRRSSPEYQQLLALIISNKQWRVIHTIN
jgi:NADH-quinone oxidoreductase subunit B